MEPNRLLLISGLFAVFLIRPSSGIICPKCGRDFVSIGRHSWRCLGKGTSADNQPVHHPITASPAGSPRNPVTVTCATTSPTSQHSLRRVRHKKQQQRDSSSSSRSPSGLCIGPAAVRTDVVAPQPARTRGGPLRDDRPARTLRSPSSSSSSPSPPRDVTQGGRVSSLPPLPPSTSSTSVSLACHCGKICRGNRGLKAHQRSCTVIETLLQLNPHVNRIAYTASVASISIDALVAPDAPVASVAPVAMSVAHAASGIVPHIIMNESADTSNIMNECTTTLRPTILQPTSLQPVPGLRLPRTAEQWAESHSYFLAYPPLPPTIVNSELDSLAAAFQCNIYNYFRNECGLHRPFATRHAPANTTTMNKKIRSLRKSLYQLKSTQAPADRIQRASKQLRISLSTLSKVKVNKHSADEESKHNNFTYKKNPWAFMKAFQYEDKNSPTFGNIQCHQYFQDILKEKNPSRIFERPDWMPIIPPPNQPFVHSSSPPTFKDVSNIVRRMRARSSPCPLDGLSVIIFQKCPILRTHLSRLLHACWMNGHFPAIWKRASVSLIHKKGPLDSPQNFRPIALQPVLGKIFNATIRNRLHTFLLANNLLEMRMQKGFWPGVDGVTEHIAHLKYLLHLQKKHKREIYVILLDLKNAFGEVHHSLIRFALRQHHVPEETVELVMSQYNGFFLNVTAKNCDLHTDPIHVQRGVLQGDTLSPLLFNLVFDSLMSTLADPKFPTRGIMWGDGRTQSMWTQFADDAAIINDSFKEAQLLLSFFNRWTSWADLTIRPDKSYAYGAAQRSGRYQQILPNFHVAGVTIPPIPIGERMSYLGCDFSFASDTVNAKTNLESALREILALVGRLPISSHLKCHALNLQMRAHLSFAMSHHPLPVTWIKTCLDAMVLERVRRWLDLPPGATVHFVPLPHRLLGLDLILPSLLAELCRFGTNMTLSLSRDPRMRTLLDLSHSSHPLPFHLPAISSRRGEAVSKAKEIQYGRSLQCLDGLQIQATLHKALRDSLPQSELASWSGHIQTITSAISNFARKALIRCLPTNSNLHRWDRSKSESCPHCGASETEKHILNNCSVAATEGRYTWRHNAVLRYLISVIQPGLSSHHTVYADLPDQRSPSELYTDILPDLTIVRGAHAYILELTCCYETNFLASKGNKLKKYTDPSRSAKERLVFHVSTLEVSSLGFVCASGLRKFLADIGAPPLEAAAVRRMGELALRASFFVFCNRHKAWPATVSDPYFI